jgi:P27 family predicted phage terminase small subunit
MHAGRRPKPSQLRYLEGNPGKRPINDDEPKPDVEIPGCPDHLLPEAAEEWLRISKELFYLGLISQLDRAALAAYCQSYGEWVRYTKLVRQFGDVVKTPNGYPVLSPYKILADRALAAAIKYGMEFGLTPASRSRISGPAGDQMPLPFDPDGESDEASFDRFLDDAVA